MSKHRGASVELDDFKSRVERAAPKGAGALIPLRSFAASILRSTTPTVAAATPPQIKIGE